MGNTVSTEQEYESSQSNVEEWPPIKHWTAERAREEGLAPLTTVQDHSCLGCHKEQHGSEPPVAPETHSPQFQVEDFSNNPPCPGDWTCRFCGLLSSRHFRVCLICFSPSPHERSSRHMWLTQELTRLKKVARSPNWHVLAQPTALSPGRKQEPAASYGLDGRTSDGHKKSLKRVAKHAALDSEEYNEVFDSQESSPNLTTPLNTGKNGTLHSDSKGRALACMNCLRRMASTRLKRPFLGCHNQPGRDDNARCQNCKQAAQGCHLPPVELQDAARALQAAWEDARHNLIISGRLSILHAIQGAWEQYSRELNEFQAVQAAERVQGLSTASYRSTPEATGRLSVSSSTRILIPDPFTSPPRTQRYRIASSDTSNSGEKETSSADSDSDSEGKSVDSLEELERIIEEAEAAAESDDDFQPDCSSDISDGSDSNLSTGRKRRRWSESSPGSALKRVRSFY